MGLGDGGEGINELVAPTGANGVQMLGLLVAESEGIIRFMAEPLNALNPPAAFSIRLILVFSVSFNCAICDS